MTLYYLAAAFLVSAVAHYALGGDLTNFFRRHGHLNKSGKLKKHNPNAVLAIVFLALCLSCIVTLLIVPSVPVQIKSGIGLVITSAVIAVAIYRRRATQFRTLAFIASGTLILVGSFW